jgi:hypothetical protein
VPSPPTAAVAVAVAAAGSTPRVLGSGWMKRG